MRDGVEQSGATKRAGEPKTCAVHTSVERLLANPDDLGCHGITGQHLGQTKHRGGVTRDDLLERSPLAVRKISS